MRYSQRPLEARKCLRHLRHKHSPPLRKRGGRFAVAPRWEYCAALKEWGQLPCDAVDPDHEVCYVDHNAQPKGGR
jgi:hypothetical protein